VRSQAYYLDITDRSANKARCSGFVETHVDSDDGNRRHRRRDNDVAMFELAGLSIAIGNGKSAQAAADFLTDGNGEDGFARRSPLHFGRGSHGLQGRIVTPSSLPFDPVGDFGRLARRCAPSTKPARTGSTSM